MIKLCVPGAGGRMGQMVIAEALARDDIAVVSACEDPGHPAIGTEAAPGVTVSPKLAALAEADVYIDFTVPAATRQFAEAALEHNTAAVIGTTGLDHDAGEALDALSKAMPIVVAPNFSLGVNLMLVLAEQAARTLGPEFDLEVVETHHKMKRDAPSGTAIALAEALALGRGQVLDDVKRYSREGDIGPRKDGEIGVSTVRGGDVAGEHTAFFFGPSERIEITHRATSRAIFARGALRAAAWVVGKPAGRYTMRDVLGL